MPSQCVTPGLDPGVHLFFAKMMDCRVKPGNDENPYMIDAYAGLRTAANSGECKGPAARLLVE